MIRQYGRIHAANNTENIMTKLLNSVIKCFFLNDFTNLDELNDKAIGTNIFLLKMESASKSLLSD